MPVVLTEGFESDQGWTHNSRIFPVSGEPYNAQVGNVFAPKSWTAWWEHEPGELDQPEMTYVWEYQDKRRIRTGKGAYKVFTFSRKHRAGLFRPVPVPPGSRVRVTAYPHAWSNGYLGGPHNHDPRWSEWAGYEERDIAFEDAPPFNGDPQNDAAANVIFRVGISPTGGQDLDTVSWGDGRCIYNDYNSPVTYEAIATGPIVTVWLWSSTLWQFTHNDAYWDDVTVEVLDGAPEPPEPPVPTQRGKPRVQYERTVNVYAEGSLETRVVEIAREAYRLGRQTVTGSYDDAGVGDLDNRVAVLWDIPEDKRNEFLAFYETYYPGVKVEFAGGAPQPEPEQLRLTYPTTYMPPYITQRFSATHRGLDLRSSYKLWGSEAVAALSGKVIASTRSDVFGNYVLVQTGLDDGSTVECRYAHLEEPLPVFVGEAVMRGQKLGRCGGTANPPVADHLHFSVKLNGSYVDPEPLIDWPDVPPTPPVPPPPLTYNPRSLGLHLQTMVAGALEYVRDAKPSCTKRIQGAQDLITLHNLNPGMACVYRAYPEGQTPMDHVAHNLDTLRQVCDAGVNLYFEGPNEVYGGDRASNLRWIEWEREFVRLLKAAEPRCKPVTFCAAVGNPPEEQWADLIPLAQDTTAAGGMLGYHTYWACNPTWCSLDNFAVSGRWLEFRWQFMDNVFAAAGVKPRWFFGEMGAVEGWPPATTGDPWAGWKSPKCLNGNWSQYLAQLGKFAQSVADWNLTHQGRAVGGAIFTSGQGTGWPDFQIAAEQMAALRDMQLSKWPV